jgi:proteic killer suppression protein
MIKSFRDKEAQKLFLYGRSKSPEDVQRVTLRKLEQLNAAKHVADLAAFPGNRPEPLKGKRLGQHSIRINDQWRICFVWKDGHVYDVEICDYH